MAANRANGRLVAGVNGAVASLLVAVLAVVALVVKPPSPPGIAEFAPQATKPIQKAPPGQAAVHGSGPGGGCATGQSCARPTALPSGAASVPAGHKGVPSELQCHEWPDGSVTQTFDPQSPPCIATWPEAAQGNGGATTRGVTGSEIRVAIRESDLTNEGATAQYSTDLRPNVNALFAFFNSHYQLYGRKLVLRTYKAPSASSASEAHASAIAASDVQPFSVLMGRLDTAAMAYELAENHVLTASPGADDGFSSARLQRSAPYAWTYEPPDDVVQKNLAEFVCTSLAGKRAIHSPEESTSTRKFAVAIDAPSEGLPATDTKPLLAALRAGCDVQAKVVQLNNGDGTGGPNLSTATRLRGENVTTILTLSCCASNLEMSADQIGWHPEWVLYGKHNQYPTQAMSGFRGNQESTRFGLAPTNRRVALAEEPYYQAAPSNLRRGSYPYEIYRTLQMVAAGVQMAGARLTPAAFAEGLHGTDFPNPGAGGPPAYQAAAGFSGSETWMLRDLAVWWTDLTRQGNTTGSYELCYVDRGRRWTLGTWVDIDAKIRTGLGDC